MILLSLQHAYYQFNGSFNLPYANISQPLSVFKNATHMQVDILNGNTVSLYAKQDHLYQVVTRIDHKDCTKLPKLFAQDAPEYVPDLTEFSVQSDLVLVNGTFARHYARKGVNSAEVPGSTFFATLDFQQDFYCLPLNEEQCIPLRYEIRGYNTITGSHTDLYVVVYDEFDAHPDSYVLKLPSSCVAGRQRTKFGYQRPVEMGSFQDYRQFEASGALPAAFDWRVRAFLTPVRDQASCGSCWAFSAAQVIEFQVNKNRGRQSPVKVSEQQIISCLWEESSGCNGGFSMSAFQEIITKKDGKIPVEQDYQGVETQCKAQYWTTEYGQMTRFYRVESSIDQMKLALLEGPVGVAVAVPESFVYYTGGIYSDKACGNGANADLVHAVTLVGWGTDMVSGDYWIIKNSWSNAWGMDGYMFLSMENDLCGVLQEGVSVEISNTEEILPKSFEFNGRFNVPFANVSQPIQAIVDSENQRMKFSFYDDVQYTIWNGKEYYSVFTYFDNDLNASTQKCVAEPTYTGFDKTQLLTVLPDITLFTRLKDVIMYGKTFRHYQLYNIDIVKNPPTNFKAARDDYQNFYCEFVNNECIPLRWEFYGMNTLFGSHYDYYILNYDSFVSKPTFNSQDFQKPDLLCTVLGGTKSSKFGYKRASSQQFKYNLTSQFPLPEITSQYYLDVLNRKVAFPQVFNAHVNQFSNYVLDQCSCGSCWAFGTASAITARAKIAGAKVIVSEQSIIDCIWAENLNGCDGGEANDAIEQMMRRYSGKLADIQSYHYTGVTQKCQTDKWTLHDVQLKGFVNYYEINNQQLKYLLLSGPVTIAISVPESMMSYNGGIYDDEECKDTKYEDLVHQVLLVGWGINDEGVEYWIIQNSWSNIWGSNGFIYIKFGYCGVTLAVTAAVVQKIE
ncbi:Cathepsin L [Spironucleus salmonicida]|uniref:Cathepsin L n=1 Tax=Spironucleus salmonicida TaxID=348837 RepID=V6LGP0_9EUKA|nr:Cathepsin L [Spironucleus salmonicida]|eukprot:EST43478.1 Papain family cysteine protease domain-containing protein [Spironucleus salmonicida]